MLDVRKLLAQRPLLFDGGMGTYYKAKPGQECEQANLTDPEGILAVHRAYLAAGADAIKTNTFSLPRLAAAQQPGWEQLADAGWQLAVKAAGETGAAVFADLGPAPDTENLPAEQVYLAVAKRFALLGARNFLFETLSAEDGVLEAIREADRAGGLCTGILCGAAGRLHPRGPLLCRACAPRGAERRGGCRRPELRICPGCDAGTGAAAGGCGTAPFGHAQCRLPGGGAGTGALSGQAGVFCPGAEPPCQ